MSVPAPASKLGGEEEDNSYSNRQQQQQAQSPAARAMAAAMMGVRMPFSPAMKQVSEGEEDGAPPPPAPEDDSMPPPPPAPEDDDPSVAPLSSSSSSNPSAHASSYMNLGPQPIVSLPAFGSGLVSGAGGNGGSNNNSSGISSEDEKLWSDMMKNGGMFTKYKYAKGQRRLIWCPSSLDRLLWGDEKKKKVKGYIMVCDITAVREGCEGSKKKDLALTVVSDTRLLELECMDSQQKKVWTDALNWLIGAGGK